MGDFSVPCVISGLPIAGRQQVVGFQIRKARWDDAEVPFAPVCAPFRGTMGDYGRILEDDRIPAFSEDEKTITVYAHVDLFTAATTIFRKAMPKKGSLWEEMKARRARYLEEMDSMVQIEPDPEKRKGYDGYPLQTLKSSIARHDIEPWIGLMHHLLICVSDDETFETDLFNLITKEFQAEVLDEAKVKPMIDDIETLLAAVAASRITGHPIQPPGYTFEQYPSFKWEWMWHSVVAAKVSEFRNGQQRIQDQVDSD